MPTDICSPLKLKNLTIKNRLFLAPVDGVFDLPWRKIAIAHGIGLTCSEMVAAQGLKFAKEKVTFKLKGSEEERPYQVQISGHELDFMAYAASVIEAENLGDIVDLNMGCPSKLVTRSGNGVALMKSPDQIRDIAKTVRAAINIPLSAKIRAGWNFDSINAVEIAHILESEGVDMITVHPRTKTQAFGGNANWEIIAKVKAAVSIPVIGNGDVKSSADAKKMLSQTNCDGVMIARGAFGNPWLIDNILKDDDTFKPEKQEILDTILQHIEFQTKHYPKQTANKSIRKHLSWYVKGLPKATTFRREALIIEEREELEDYLRHYFEQI